MVADEFVLVMSEYAKYHTGIMGNYNYTYVRVDSNGVPVPSELTNATKYKTYEDALRAVPELKKKARNFHRKVKTQGYWYAGFHPFITSVKRAEEADKCSCISPSSTGYDYNGFARIVHDNTRINTYFYEFESSRYWKAGIGFRRDLVKETLKKHNNVYYGSIAYLYKDTFGKEIGLASYSTSKTAAWFHSDAVSVCTFSEHYREEELKDFQKYILRGFELDKKGDPYPIFEMIISDVNLKWQ